MKIHKPLLLFALFFLFLISSVSAQEGFSFMQQGYNVTSMYNGQTQDFNLVRHGVNWSHVIGSSFPAACPSNTYVTQTGVSNTCTAISQIDNKVTLDVNGDSGASTSTGGALLVENTGNVGAGIVVYSNIGATANGDLVNIRSNNDAFDRSLLQFDYRGTGNAITGNYRTNESSGLFLTLTSFNELDSAVGVTSYTQAKAGVKFVHIKPGSSDSGSSVMSLVSQGSGTGAHLLFGDAEDGTTGDLLNLRDQGTERFTVDSSGMVDINQDSDAHSIVVDTESTSEGGVTITADAAHTGSGSDSVLYVRANNAGADGRLVTLEASSASGSKEILFIDQNSPEEAINLDYDGAGDNDVIVASTDSSHTGGILRLEPNGDADSGYDGAIEISNGAYDGSAIAVWSSMDNEVQYPMVSLRHETVTDYDKSILEIKSKATGAGGYGLYCEHDGNQPCIYVNMDGSTTASETAGAVFLDNSGNNNTALAIYTNVGADSGRELVSIVSDNSAYDVNLVDLRNDGSGDSLNIDNNGAGDSIGIAHEDSGAATWGLNLNAPSTNNQILLGKSQTGDRYGAYIKRNYDSTETAQPVVRLVNDHPQDDQHVIQIQQDGNASYIAGVGKDEIEWHIGDPDTSYRASFSFERNVDSSGTNSPVFKAQNSHTGDDRETIYIYNEAAGVGLFADQNGEDRAIQIDTEATDFQAIRIDSQVDATAAGDPEKYAIYVANENLGGGYYNYRNQAAATSMINILQDHASDTSTVANFRNDGTGILLQLDYNGVPGTNNAALRILADGVMSATNTYAQRIYSNAAHTGGYYIEIRDDNAASNVAAGIRVDMDGDGDLIELENRAGADGLPISIANAGASADIYIQARTTAPATCTEGSIYTDDSGAFCYCNTANTWENLASGGSCA